MNSAIFFLLAVLEAATLSSSQQTQQQAPQEQQQLLIPQYPLYEDYNPGSLQTSQDTPTLVYHFRPRQDPFDPAVIRTLQKQENEEKAQANKDQVRYLLLQAYQQPQGVNPVLALQAKRGSEEFQPQVAIRPLHFGLPYQNRNPEDNRQQHHVNLPPPPPEYQPVEKPKQVPPTPHVTYLNPNDAASDQPQAHRRPVTRIVIKRPHPPTQVPYNRDSGLKQSEYTNVPFTQPIRGSEKSPSSRGVSYPVQYFPPPPANRDPEKYFQNPSSLHDPPSSVSYQRSNERSYDQRQRYEQDQPDNRPKPQEEEKDEEDDVSGSEHNDVSGIPGDPGKDYPIISKIPTTSFSCHNKLPGYYADKEQRCQVYYFCDPQGHMRSFLCPNGTLFNQQSFVCEWWYNVDCSSAEKFYAKNNELYKPTKRNFTQEQKPVYFFIPRSQLNAQDLKNYQLQLGSVGSYPSQPSTDPRYQKQENHQRQQQPQATSNTGGGYGRPSLGTYQPPIQPPPVEYKTAVAPPPPTYRSAVTPPIRGYRDTERIPNKATLIYGVPREGESYKRYRDQYRRSY